MHITNNGYFMAMRESEELNSGESERGKKPDRCSSICGVWNNLPRQLANRHCDHRLTFGRNDQTTSLGGSTVDSLDNVNHLSISLNLYTARASSPPVCRPLPSYCSSVSSPPLVVVDWSSHLVIVTSSQINHDMLVSGIRSA
jgi:hypothetical protein